MFSIALISATRPARSQLNPIKISPSWVVAYERDRDIWIADATGKYERRLIENANTPKWSPDGKRIAFVRGRDVMIYDVAGKRERKAFRFSKNEESEDGGAEKFLDWDSKRPALLIATEYSDVIHIVNLSANFGAISTDLNGIGVDTAPNYAPRWSPSGRWLAFVREGDIYLAGRGRRGAPMKPDGNTEIDGEEGPMPRSNPIVPGSPKDTFTTYGYFDEANRVAAVAFFNIGNGASVSTPFWARELAWTRNEDRLYFDWRRVGGSGTWEIGYVTWPGSKPGAVFGNDRKGSRAVVHWLPLEDVATPRICPDGHTLSFVKLDFDTANHWLVVSDKDGAHIPKLFHVGWNFDWRPK